MPINDNYKIIFIHIPKTGGTSIELFFEMAEPENFCFYRWDRDQVEFLKKYKNYSNSEKINFEPQHYPLEVLKDLIKNYNDYFKFSFTRNPYTKLLSEYYWLNSKQLNSLNDFNPKKFHDWIVSYLSILNNSHKEPQINYIDKSVDFVGKYENLSTDFELLKLKLIDFSPKLNTIKNKALTHMNSTGLDKKDLIQWLLPESKQLIYNTYQSDFKKFSYNNEL